MDHRQPAGQRQVRRLREDVRLGAAATRPALSVVPLHGECDVTRRLREDEMDLLNAHACELV